MDVAGLPAAACDLLTTLLAKNRVTSWQVSGKGRNAVFTLRLTATDHEAAMTPALSQWKKKSPSQIRRDQHRANLRQGQTKVGETEIPLSLRNQDDATVKPNGKVSKGIVTDKQREQVDKHTVRGASAHAREIRCKNNVMSNLTQPGVVTRSRARTTGHGGVIGDEKRAKNINTTGSDSVSPKGHCSLKNIETETPARRTSTNCDIPFDSPDEMCQDASSIRDMERTLSLSLDKCDRILRNISGGIGSAPGD